jgi:hypothetical protein
MLPGDDGRGIDWPVWSAEAAPGDLARYVVPDVVRQHAEIPGPSDAPVLQRVRIVWDRLRDCGIGYAHERPPDTLGGASAGGQWIRPPAEMLVAPRIGTCLDLAVLLAGALRHVGLCTAVIVLDAADPGRPGHALVAVWLDDSWPAGMAHGGVGAARPTGLDAVVQAGLDEPPAAILVLDPNGIAHAVGPRAIGTDVALDRAVARGHAHLTSAAYRWRVGVVADLGV